MITARDEEPFIREYLVDLNATQAYMRAYNCANTVTAGPAGWRMLRKASVAARIQAEMDARGERTQITADTVLTELGKLAFANIGDYMSIQSDGTAFVDLSALTPEQAAAISEIQVDEYVEGKGEDTRNVKRVKIKLVDKGVNLERLGRHLKLFTDKIEVSGLEQLAERIRLARENADLLG